MTISSFCRDLLLARGPLPLQALSDLAVAAGATSARDPVAAVRGVISSKEVQLADGRWATPLWLLEGRVLTVRRLPGPTAWTAGDLDDDSDLLLDGADLDGSTHDLAPLAVAARCSALPVAGGGLLRRDHWSDRWQTPKGWPGIRPGRGQLLALQVRQGQVCVELVTETAEMVRAGERLAAQLGPLDAPRRYWAPDDSAVSDALVDALWNLMAEDPTFLTAPVPPLSECVPPLAGALRAARDAQLREQGRWRPRLDLPGELRQVALEQAHDSGQVPDEWLAGFVSGALRELEEQIDGRLDQAVADVLPWRPRPWR